MFAAIPTHSCACARSVSIRSWPTVASPESAGFEGMRSMRGEVTIGRIIIGPFIYGDSFPVRVREDFLTVGSLLNYDG